MADDGKEIKESIDGANVSLEEFKKKLKDVQAELKKLESYGPTITGPQKESLEIKRQESAELEKIIKSKEQELKIENDLLRSAEKSRDLAKAELDVLEETNKSRTVADANEKTAQERDKIFLQKKLEYQKEELKFLLLKKQLTGETSEAAIKAAATEIANTEKQLADLTAGQEKLNEKTDLLKKRWEQISQLLEAAIGQTAKQVTQFFSLTSQAKAFGDTIDLVVKSNESLAKNFGNIDFSLVKSVGNLSQFGAGVAEITAASNALYNNMSAFSAIKDPAIQSNLVASAAKMEALGVSIETSSKNFNEFNKGLGIGYDRAGKVSESIVKALGPSGINPVKALGDINAILPQISASGQKAIDIYVELQKQSKTLGMDVSELTSIVGKQFDTFEGAADAAGKLNQILGGDYLNATRMVNADEKERVQILKDAFAQTGKNFDSLDRYEKKAIAASLGIKDVTTASKLFREASLEEQLQMARTAASEEELTKAQEKAADTQKQLSIAMQATLQLVEPFAKGLKNIAMWLAENKSAALTFVTVISGLVISTLIGFIYNIYIAGKTIISLSSNIGNLITKFSQLGVTAQTSAANVLGASGQIQTGNTIMQSSTAGTGAAADKATPSLVKLGIAILFIGAGIAIAAYGLAQLVMAFKGVENAGSALLAVGAVMAGFAVIVMFMAKASIASAGPIAALGFALLLIGGAIYVASLGLVQLVKAFGEIKNAGEALAAVTLVMTQFTLMVGVLAAVSAVAWEPIITLGGALFLVGAGIGLAAAGISTITTSFKELGSIGSGVKSLVSAINDLKQFKKEEFSGVKTGLSEISEILNKIDSKKQITININKNITETLSSKAINKDISEEEVSKNLDVQNKLFSSVSDVKSVTRINNIKDFSESIVQLSRAESRNIEPATRFVVAAKEYQMAQQASTNFGNEKLVDSLLKLTKTPIAQGGGLAAGTRVTIVIDNATQLEGFVRDAANSQPAIGVTNKGPR